MRRQRLARLERPAVAVLSAAAHGLVLLALLSARPEPVKVFEPPAMEVLMVDAPRITPTPKPPAPSPTPTKPPPPRHVARVAPLPPDVEPVPLAGDADTPTPGVELSDGQIAGAIGAGSGPGGRQCDMARWLQTALQKNPRVQSALASNPSRGKALMVWNGDWLRHPSQEGEGMAVIREAIMLEVMSSPAACRKEPMRGLFLIALNDAPGSTRVAVGADDWRWSDLLIPRYLRR